MGAPSYWLPMILLITEASLRFGSNAPRLVTRGRALATGLPGMTTE